MTDINGNTVGALSNVASNPLDKDLNISDYNIVGLPFGSSLRTIQSTQILQTSIINDSANKLLNVGDVVSGTTEMTGILKVPSIATNTITNSVNANSSINMFDGQIYMNSTGNLYFNNNTVVCTPSLSPIESSSFKVTGGTSDSYMMSDGSLLKYSANSGNSNYYLYNSSTTQNVTPPIGDITYNNAVQANATIIYISHRTRDTIDIEVFFKQLSSLIEVYIQDQETSLNYIQYNIIGTPTITPEAQVAIPVIMRVGAGTGLTNFSNGHNVLLSFFTNSIETDLRISTLENQTVNQTAINGVSTNFTGTNGVVSTKFVKSSNPNSNHFWKTDGSADSNIYVLDSDLIITNANVTTLQTKTQNLTSTTSTSTFTGTGGIIADKFVTNTGTSLSFVKGDGSLDSTGYATLSLVNDVVNLINPVITKTQYQSISGGDTYFSTGLVLNGSITTDGISNIDILSMDKPFFGIQYNHGSAIINAQSNSNWTPAGSTTAVVAPYSTTTNVTRQIGAALWSFPTPGDGQICGYGSTITTGAQVCTGFPFGLIFVGNIADTGYNVNNCQNVFGLWSSSSPPSLSQSVQLSVRLNHIVFGSDTNDPNICIYTAGAAGVSNKQVDLGSSFPANRPSANASTDWLKLCMYWDGSTTLYYKAVNTTLNVTVSGSFVPIAGSIPISTFTLYPQCCRVMGTPNASGQAKLIVKRFGVF